MFDLLLHVSRGSTQLLHRCLATPCHTRDSICYCVMDSTDSAKAVFTGYVICGFADLGSPSTHRFHRDTLFIAGCGRFFEGSPEEMHRALSYLGSLPDSTVVFSGHEYTRGNLKFVQSVAKSLHLKKLFGLLMHIDRSTRIVQR